MNRKMLSWKIILMSIFLSVGIAQNTFASTYIYLDFDSTSIDDIGIAAIEFSILGSDTVTADNFTANFPDGWLDNSEGSLISAFDFDGGNSLSNGEIGFFDIDVTLGDWELTLQNGDILTTLEYEVLASGSNYILADAGSGSSSPVPIPSAIFLFGGGLFGMLGIRRKIK